MRFFKSFSLLHRRVKSETGVVQISQTCPLFLSVDQLDEQVPTLNNNIFDTFVPIDTPATFVPPVTVSAGTVAAPQQTLATLNERVHTLVVENRQLKSNSANSKAGLNKRILALEYEISRLRCTDRIDSLQVERVQLNSTIQVLLHTTTELSNEASTLRCELYDTIRQKTHFQRVAQETEEELQELQQKLVQFSRFIGLMVDIGLHEAVLARACTALREGDDADDALIDSIKEAATKPESSWSKIIPAVTGPRTPDEYLSAINMTLKLRRELKDSRKIAKFWKRSAKEGPEEHVDTITPSVSNISSIHETLNEQRQNQVDDLLARLRSGTYRSRCKNTEFKVTGAAVPSEDHTTLCQDDHTQVSTATSNGYEKPITTCDAELTTCDSSSTIRRCHVPKLPPLASQSFKEELISTQSYKHISASSSRIYSRVALGNVDLNLSSNKPTAKSNRSTKALGKRRAMVVTQSIESIKVTFFKFISTQS